MSGMNCIHKANKQFSGSVRAFMLGIVTPSNGQRTALFVIATMLTLLAEFVGGMLIITSVLPLGQSPGPSAFGGLVAGAIVLAMIMVATAVYAMAVYDNCVYGGSK